MGNLLNAVFFVSFVNLILILSGLAITNINPQQSCLDPDETVLGPYSNKEAITADPTAPLPKTNNKDVTTDTGFGTDLFNMLISSIKSIPIIGDLIKVLSAPFTMLSCMKILPEAFINFVAGFWYFVSAIVLISFIFWRE